MVFGQPETPIAPTLSVLREIKGVMQSLCGSGALRYECQIKN
jgi:hypothetical protein